MQFGAFRGAFFKFVNLG